MDGPNDTTGHTAGTLARLYWMCIGGAALLILFFLIIRQNPPYLSPANGAYWATVLSLVIVRYVDIRYLRGETAGGTPATLVHWRKYASNLFMASLAAWIIAQLI